METLPTELHLLIFGFIDNTEDVCSFLCASKSLYSVFKRFRNTILQKVIINEFKWTAPLDDAWIAFKQFRKYKNEKFTHYSFIKYKLHFVEEYYKSSRQFNLYTYMTNINIGRVMSGMYGLSYSN